MGIPAIEGATSWARRLEAQRMARIEQRRAAQREADVSRVEPFDVDVAAWEAMRGGYQAQRKRDCDD